MGRDTTQEIGLFKTPFIESDLENFQGWGSHRFSKPSVPVPHHPHCKEPGEPDLVGSLD